MNARTDTLGLFYGMDIDKYHASPAISNSGLRDFARSPAHFYGLHLDPDRPAPVEKAGQLEGTLAHCAILEPAQFDARYAVGPDVSRSTKEWKAFEASQSRQCIKPDQYAAAQAQARAVHQLPDIARILSAGQPEVSAFWIDPDTGVLCRCRPDWVHPVGNNSVVLLDVKTYSDASPKEFARQVARKGYHNQAAWYSDGYEQASGQHVVGFVFVAVESAWPHAASAVMLDDEGLAKGRADNRLLLDQYARCLAGDEWPGFTPTIELITLPAWAL